MAEGGAGNRGKTLELRNGKHFLLSGFTVDLGYHWEWPCHFLLLVSSEPFFGLVVAACAYLISPQAEK